MAVKGWTMAAVAVAVAAGTYFALETIYPPSKNGDVDLRVVSADTVFGDAPADIDDGGEPAAGVAELAPAKTPDADDHALDAAMAPSEDNLMVTDEALAADEPAPSVTAPADEAVEDEAAEDEAVEAGQEAAAQAESAVGDTQSASADDEAVESTPPPAPKPSPAATAAPTPSTTAAPRSTPRAAPATTPAPQVTQWWGPESDARLSVVYAGSAAYTRAIVLMFNGAFRDAASAQQHLRVRDAAGNAVSGNWEVGASNRRMLLFPISRTGIYTVSVGAGLADQSGRTVGKELQGPVRVQ